MLPNRRLSAPGLRSKLLRVKGKTIRLRIAGRTMEVTQETIEAIADALNTDTAAAAKWLRRGPAYYSEKARPTMRPWKPFRGRVVGAEVQDAGWRVITADDLRDEERFYHKDGDASKRGDPLR